MKCKVDGCGKAANRTWALVPVCRECREEIHHEHRLYYAKRIISCERVVYFKIKHLTPWGRKN